MLPFGRTEWGGTLVRFIHSSDLHLGKPFGRFDEDVRVRLREARFQKISRLASEARRLGAPFILLAGDTFDAETPPPQTIRHALRAMAAENDITWVILPGNHDPLSATELWGRISREKSDNIILALEAKPIQLQPGAVLLPAPPTVKHPGRDLTEWMSDVSSGDAIRVGLAHGAIQDFSSDDPSLGIIPPNRADLSDLDYLALGDWHGQMKIGPRTWYSGAPEADHFKSEAAAGALLVEIEAKGVLPVVQPVHTGSLFWKEVEIDFRPGDEIADRLNDALPPPMARRDSIISLKTTGRLTLSEMSFLGQVISGIREDFGHFEDDLGDLDIEQEVGDLDSIDRAGALRAAAERLQSAGSDPLRCDEDRRISRTALGRLYAYAMELS